MAFVRPDRLPIGVVLRTIDAEPGWWLESARRLDEAGYAGLWAWDHFVGRGDETVPVVESWTILSMAAASTSQATVGTFVANVMNRHPALLARMASTLQIASGGKFVLGMGIGGAPREHQQYGMDFPDAKERVARLTEAVAVIRALWQGGPVTRPSEFYPLDEAVAHPVPVPPRSSSAARRGLALAWPAASATAGRPCTTTSRRTCPRMSRRWRTAAGRAQTSG
jgi:alkanesulfonate monooxygenase SsuD/methylene tetrahydromethanopterin reductase-like flavin-dependent oxidoreductase (luciferase family)